MGSSSLKPATDLEVTNSQVSLRYTRVQFVQFCVYADSLFLPIMYGCFIYSWLLLFLKPKNMSHRGDTFRVSTTILGPAATSE